MFRSGLFDANWCRDNYLPDLKDEVELFNHYISAQPALGWWPGPYFDCPWYISRYRDVMLPDTHPIADFMQHWREGRRPNAHFDPVWYGEHDGETAIQHFARVGDRLRVRPSPDFDPDFYCEVVGKSDDLGFLPLHNYLHFGRARGIPTVRTHAFAAPSESVAQPEAPASPRGRPAETLAAVAGEPWAPLTREEVEEAVGFFDELWYCATNAHIGLDEDLLEHFIRHGDQERRPPNAGFDSNWYAAQPGGLEGASGPAQHYLRHGRFRGRPTRDAAAPHPELLAAHVIGSDLFDAQYYLKSNADVAHAKADPLIHFINDGSKESRPPSRMFDANWYVGAYADVKASGLDPFRHYLYYGRRLGRPSLSPPAYTRWVEAFDMLSALDLTQIDQHIAREGVAAPAVLLLVDEENLAFLDRTLASIDDQRLTPRFVYISHDFAGDRAKALNDALSARRDIRVVDEAHDVRGPVVVCGGAVSLRPNALYMLALAAGDATSLVYADHDHLSASGERERPVFKPDASPRLAQSRDYVGSCALVVRPKDLLRRLRLAGGAAALFSEMLVDDPAGVAHTPFVLHHELGDAREEGRPAAHPALPCPAPPPKVSIIIPTRDHADLLAGCVGSITDLTAYPHDLIEILIVDNGSTDARTFQLLETLRRDRRIKIIKDGQPFNYSRLNNNAAAVASGEVLVLLNNDTKVVDANWLKVLVRECMRPGVGAVGPKLLYDDGTIQHAGVVLNVGGVAAHAHLGSEREAPGYMGLAQLTHEVGAVTGACLAVRRDLYLQAGGLDEGLRVAFNDVSFCMSLLEAGLLNIYVADTAVVHLESKTRGIDDTEQKIDQFISEAQYVHRKHAKLCRGDPYYNPNLSLDPESIYQPAFPPRVRKPWRAYAREHARPAKPHILIVGPTLEARHAVGQTMAVEARELLARGHRVSVAAPSPDAPAQIGGAAWIRVDSAREAAMLAATAEPDLVLSHGGEYTSLARWLGGRVPVFLHLHGDPPPGLYPVPGERRSARVAQELGRNLASHVTGAGAQATPATIPYSEGGDAVGVWSSALSGVGGAYRAASSWAGLVVALLVADLALAEEVERMCDLAAGTEPGRVAFATVGALAPALGDRLSAAGIVVRPDEAADVLTAADLVLRIGNPDPFWEAQARGLGLQVVALQELAREDPLSALAGHAVREPRGPADVAAWSTTLRPLVAAVEHVVGRAAPVRPVLASDRERVERSGLFDRAFYLETYPDIADSGADPLDHYLEHGGAEGRSSSPLFDGPRYLRMYPDVGLSGTNPLVDYLQRSHHDREPNAFFSDLDYLSANPQAADSPLSPLEHYLEATRRGSPPGVPKFDPAFYAENTPEAQDAPSLFEHFLRVGVPQRLPPTAYTMHAVDLYEDAAVERVLGRPLDEVLWVPQAAERVEDKWSAARFVVDLLRASPPLRARFPHALCDGAEGAFATWLHEEGGRGLGLSDDGIAAVGQALSSGLERRPVSDYLLSDELRSLHPLALTPAGSGRWLKAMLDDRQNGLRLEEIWWAVLRGSEDPLGELTRTYAFTPDWQRRFPEAATRFGRREFLTWMAASLGVELLDAWRCAPRHEFRAADQLKLALALRPRWREAVPDALAGRGGARRLLEFARSEAAGCPQEVRDWLEGLDAEAVVDDLLAPAANLLAHFCYPSGLKISSDALLNGLERVGGRVARRDVTVDSRSDTPEHGDYADPELHGVTIIHVQPEPLFDQAYTRAGLVPRDPRTYRVGYWYWELESVPAHWAKQVAQVDEIWAATAFVADALRATFDVPVHEVLPGVELEAFEPLPRSRFGLPETGFLFMFAFHMVSIAERKNPFGLISAFKRAFGDRDDVCLVLKTSFGDRHPRDLQRLQDACQGANIKVIDEIYTREELLALMSLSDAYVSLHRSEGFGLTMAEAMLMGKPVIATGYSGNTDFMTARNSLLVDFELVRIEQDVGPYRAGMRWAQPDLDQAASHMRRLVKQPDFARRLGERARTDLLEQMSADAAGSRIRERLEAIAQARGGTARAGTAAGVGTDDGARAWAAAAAGD